VLCELAYRWFCPPGGLVLNPFAGGSVRVPRRAVERGDHIGHSGGAQFGWIFNRHCRFLVAGRPGAGKSAFRG
jgi:hypothetical protein